MKCDNRSRCQAGLVEQNSPAESIVLDKVESPAKPKATKKKKLK